MIIARGLLAFLLFASGAAWAQTPPPPEPEAEIFTVPDQQPELIGGIAGLQRRVVYPEMARRAGVEGRVFVQFIVDETGAVRDVACARTPNELLCEAASQAVRESRFRPGQQRGRTVKVRFTLPVDFKLRDPEDAIIEDEIIEELDMDLSEPPRAPRAPVRIDATPGSVLPRLLGARWRDDLFSDLPPPRSGRIKDGNGALAFGDPDANVDRVVAYITGGVFDAFDVEFAPTASGELSQLGVDMEREFGAPRDDGFFAPSQIGIEARVRLSTETATLRFEYEPLPEELRAPPPPPPAMTPLPPPSDEVEIFEIVDQSPELIGGLPELQRRVEYPEEARLQEIEGRVFVQFIVNEIGVVEDAVCARSPNALLCDAALAAVRGSKFRPGMQRGRPVKVRFVLPVDFKLR